MAGKVSIECPACAAKLNLADSSKLGKKIKCPKCSEIFVAESTEDEVFDDEEDLEEEPEQPSSRKRAAGGGKDSAKGSKKGAAKGKSSQGNSNLPMMIGGAVGLLALVGGGLFLSGVFNSKPLPMAPSAPAPLVAAPVQPAAPPPAPPQIPAAEKVLGLRWMPPDTDLLIHAKLADIWQAPLLKEPLSSPAVATGLKEFEKQTGMLPSEIESVSFGIVDPSGSFLRVKLRADKLRNDKATAGPPELESLGFGSPPVPKTLIEELHYVLVIRTKKPVDLKRISQGIPNAKLQETNGRTFFEIAPNSSLNSPWGGWSPDSKTLLFATKKELLAAIERGETIEPRKEFKSVDHLPHLVIAMAVPLSIESIKRNADDNGTELPGFVVSLLKAHENYGFQIGSLGLTVKGGFDLKFSTLSSTDEGATKLKAEIEKQLGDFKAKFNGFKAVAPPLIADLGEMLLANLKIEGTSKIVKASTSIPDSAKEKLEQLPPVIMMMAMMGGASGFGGPPSFGSPGGLPVGIEPPNAGSRFKMPSERIKLPGESDPVESTSVEGLPEGMSLTASTAWVAGMTLAGSGGTPAPLETPDSSIEILFDVKGGDLNEICAATGVTSKTIKLDAGSTVKKSKLTLPGGIDAQKTFLPFDVESNLPFEHPPETLRVRLHVELPADAGTKINVLEGSFKYLTFENSQELTVENVPQTAKAPLKGADFKAGGVKLLRGPKDAVPESLKLECGKDHFLSKVKGTPGDIISLTEVEKGASIQRIFAKPPENKFPDDFEIAFTLYSNMKEHTVTFRFENVPLPSADSKPQSRQQPAPPQ